METSAGWAPAPGARLALDMMMARSGGRTKPSGRRVRSSWARRLPLLVAVLALFLRVWAPGPMVMTVDEPHWMLRSVDFHDALRSGDLANATADRTDQPSTMPGITTVWAGAIGTQVAEWQGGTGHQQADRMLTVSRAVVSLACSLALWLSILLAAVLVGRRAALLAGLFLAVEPWLVGHSHLLHTDAMVTMFSLAAVLAAAAAAQRLTIPGPSTPASRGKTPRALGLLTGVLTALALLTKLNAAVLIVAAIVGMTVFRAVDIHRRDGQLGAWLRAWGGVLASGLGAGLLTCLLLWPALLVRPLEQIDRLRRSAALATEATPGFSRGEVRLDPGASFYPVVVGLRMSPWLFLTTVAAFGGYVVRRIRRAPRIAPGWFTGGLLLSVLAYLAALLTATKWYDRYALPLFPFAALAAATWLASVWDRVQRKRPTPPRLGFAVVGALTVVASTITLRAAPHAIAYIDPLAGGQERAVHEIRLGWGEGMEEADGVIEHDAGNCETPRVLVNLAYAYTLRCGQTMVTAPPGGTDPTYIVEYIAQRQEGETARVLGRFADRATLAGTVQVDGLTYVWVWRIAPETPPG